jgi:GGDEF domain-containing protein
MAPTRLTRTGQAGRAYEIEYRLRHRVGDQLLVHVAGQLEAAQRTSSRRPRVGRRLRA